MPNITFAGHPLHPQLISGPLGLLPFSLVMDTMHLITGRQSFAETAYHSMIGGTLTGLAAGAAGACDYFSIPMKSQAKKVANVHAALNIGILGLYGLNLFLRKGRSTRPGLLPVLLSAIGTAGLVASSWFGGQLVYDLGMRVKPLKKGKEGPELTLPGGRKLEQAFRELEHKLGADGPRRTRK